MELLNDSWGLGCAAFTAPIPILLTGIYWARKRPRWPFSVCATIGGIAGWWWGYVNLLHSDECGLQMLALPVIGPFWGLLGAIGGTLLAGIASWGWRLMRTVRKGS